MRGATERRSRDDADHAPVEHPARSGPETLHNILTRPHVNSSSYSEDRFKVVLSFVNVSITASQHASAWGLRSSALQHGGFAALSTSAFPFHWGGLALVLSAVDKTPHRLPSSLGGYGSLAGRYLLNTWHAEQLGLRKAWGLPQAAFRSGAPARRFRGGAVSSPRRRPRRRRPGKATRWRR